MFRLSSCVRRINIGNEHILIPCDGLDVNRVLRPLMKDALRAQPTLDRHNDLSNGTIYTGGNLDVLIASRTDR
jgi:hypothetical protein